MIAAHATLTASTDAPAGHILDIARLRVAAAMTGDVIEWSVEVVGEKVGEPRGGMQLWRIEPPARFRNTQTGIYPDGWMGENASFAHTRRRTASRAVSPRSSSHGRGPAAVFRQPM